jgi:ribosomal protein L40E
MDIQARFCIYCGKPITDNKTCSNCGADKFEDAEFCIKCGTRFEKTDLAQTEKSMPSPIPVSKPPEPQYDSSIPYNKTCSSCGADKFEDAEFCIKCGKSFVETDEVQTERPIASPIQKSKSIESQTDSSNSDNEFIVYCDPFWQEDKLREYLEIFSTNFDDKIQLNEIDENVFEAVRVFEGTHKRVSYRAIVKIEIDPVEGIFISFEYFNDDPGTNNKSKIFWNNYYEGLKKLFSMSYDDIMTQGD